MKCSYHPENDAVSTCAVCGKGICQLCLVDVAGRSICPHCLSSGETNSLQSTPNLPMNTLAIVSLVLGVLGLCTGFLSIGAWVTGDIAQKQITENPYQDGMALAKAGKTLGMVITILYGCTILCYGVLMITGLIGVGGFNY